MRFGHLRFLLLGVVACGGKTRDGSAERGHGDRRPDGGWEAPPPEGSPPPGDASAALDADEPTTPPPDDRDDAVAVDPDAMAHERCRRFCELPQVQCQQALGGSRAVCTDGCVTTTLRQDSLECRDLFLGVLACVEDVLREVDCEQQSSPIESGRCTDLATTYAYSCPSQPDG